MYCKTKFNKITTSFNHNVKTKPEMLSNSTNQQKLPFITIHSSDRVQITIFTNQLNSDCNKIHKK